MRTVLRLAILGSAMEVVYLLAITRSWWLWDYFQRPGVKLPLSRNEEGLIQYIVGIVVLFVLYGAVCWSSRKGRSRWADLAVFAFPVIFATTLIPTFPVTSSDIFHYMMEGRIFWTHGDNPLVSVPASYADDPYFPFVIKWDYFHSTPYGPLWILLTGLPSALPQAHPDVVLIGYKLLGVAFYLGTAWLIWLVLSELQPQHRRLGVVLYAWNPLVLLSVAANGHNDAAMMFFAVLAFYFAVRERWHWAVPSLALAVLLKYVVLLLLPLLLYYAWRRTAAQQRSSLAVGVALAVVIAVAVFAPFWQGLDTFQAMREDQRSWFVNSTQEATLLVLAKFISVNSAMQLARTLGALAFLVPYLMVLLRLKGGPQSFIVAGYQAIFLYLLLGSSIFYPWYVIWPLSIGAALAWSPWALTGLLLSFTASFIDVIDRLVFDFHFLNGDSGLRSALAFVVAFGPPALLWTFLAWRRWSWRLWRLTPALVPEYET
ncbi:MAG: hypothetical protein A2139_05385 [Desulfobacca sp. RBG_16_60_12]|nr:MAG: hypothetical protein A2139_05385 [Desulfobacca sp. RBG_16_60_12]